MNPRVKKFIEENKQLIEKDEWVTFYEKVNEVSGSILVTDVGEMTTVFLKAGVNPLSYIDKVPERFLLGQPIKSFEIPEGITEIGDFAFMLCEDLIHIATPSALTSIGKGAFSQCKKLKQISLDNIQKVSRSAFYSCNSLESVVLSASLGRISDFAFKYCTELNNIVFKGTRKQWRDVLKGTDWYGDIPTNIVHCSDGDTNL